MSPLPFRLLFMLYLFIDSCVIFFFLLTTLRKIQKKIFLHCFTPAMRMCEEIYLAHTNPSKAYGYISPIHPLTLLRKCIHLF